MSKEVLLFDPQGPAMRSFRPVTPSVAGLQSTLTRLGIVDNLLPGVPLHTVGSGVAVADGLVADLLFVDGVGTLTILTGMFLTRSDEKYDNLFASDLLQATSEVLSWDAAALAERLPDAARAGAQAGRLRLIVPLSRTSTALEKVARLLGAAVSLHMIRWQAFADEAGRTLLFQDPIIVTPLAVAPAVPMPGTVTAPPAPAAVVAPPPVEAPAPAGPYPLTAAELAALLEREAPQETAAAQMPEPAPAPAPAPVPVAAEPPVQAAFRAPALASSGPVYEPELEGEEEAFACEATVQTLREANFVNQAREGDSRLEGAYRRMLAWARGNGRVAFTKTPSLLYRPWPDMPVTVLHALPGGRMELRLQHVIPQLSPATVADVQRRLRLLAGREVDPQATLVLEPPQSLDEDIFSVLLSTLRLVAYSRPVSGFRRRADF